MRPEDIIRMTADWGPGLLIGVLVLWGLYRLAQGVGMKMVAASEKQAEAMAKQAHSMEGLKDSIHEFVMRDTTEHREMLVLLKFIAQRQQELDSFNRRTA